MFIPFAGPTAPQEASAIPVINDRKRESLARDLHVAMTDADFKRLEAKLNEVLDHARHERITSAQLRDLLLTTVGGDTLLHSGFRGKGPQGLCCLEMLLDGLATATKERLLQPEDLHMLLCARPTAGNSPLAIGVMNNNAPAIQLLGNKLRSLLIEGHLHKPTIDDVLLRTGSNASVFERAMKMEHGEASIRGLFHMAKVLVQAGALSGSDVIRAIPFGGRGGFMAAKGDPTNVAIMDGILDFLKAGLISEKDVERHPRAGSSIN